MIVQDVAAVGLAAALGLVGYAYVGYPALLALRQLFRPPSAPPAEPAQWPMITITVPAYNEAAVIRAKLERILSFDYPADRRQILVVSDASTDGTDNIVKEFADRGVELVRLPQRGGKTAAENAARPYLRGDIVLNTDASVRLEPKSIKRLIASFADPTVGAASGRDISVARVADVANVGETGYVNYEMWVRDLETRVYGIIGASGCFYAIRKDLHMHLVPEALSRDFAAALLTREYGYRTVSVADALCYVPRVTSLRQEYRRKVRTFTRGMQTLFYKRHLLNPFRYGVFSWMLLSHKLCRWLVPWAGVVGIAAVSVLALEHPWARVVVALTALGLLLGTIGYYWPEGRRLPRLLAIPAYGLVGNLAVLHAWIGAIRGDLNPTWEPTRREAVEIR
jgi:cellulose synthase/poly-beta-1,6-N-acetylglucosamine synthase-like glycosyltransferase